MPIPIPAMKVQCPQCKKYAIFSPKRDVIAFYPHCDVCGNKMEIVGKVKFLDWITIPIYRL